jgi:hypothetical protein
MHSAVKQTNKHRRWYRENRQLSVVGPAKTYDHARAFWEVLEPRADVCVCVCVAGKVHENGTVESSGLNPRNTTQKTSSLQQLGLAHDIYQDHEGPRHRHRERSRGTEA